MKKFILKLARDAGEMALQFRQDLTGIDIRHKSDKDLVCQADCEIEKMLIQSIKNKYPDHAIIAEETGDQPGNHWQWIIDPIDGTTSFLHNQPFFCTSIALQHQGQTVTAAVNAPVLGELYYAEQGNGATCNDQPIHVSHRHRLIDAVMATGFACLRANLPDNNLKYFNAIVPKLRGIRRFGSAALDLCYVAAGRTEGFWEMNLNSYDIAAGRLIVTEAGGSYTDFAGTTCHIPYQNLATNGYLHPTMLNAIAEVDAQTND